MVQVSGDFGRAPLLSWTASHHVPLVHPCATSPPTPFQQAFDDIDELLGDGPQAFDSSRSVWHQTGAALARPAGGNGAEMPESATGLHSRKATLSAPLPNTAAQLAEHQPLLLAPACAVNPPTHAAGRRPPAAAPGWREVAALRKKLEDLRELRDLVRQLGRGGGKGPLKKAPEQVGMERVGPWRAGGVGVGWIAGWPGHDAMPTLYMPASAPA